MTVIAHKRLAAMGAALALTGGVVVGFAPAASAAYSCSGTEIRGNVWEAGYYGGGTVVPTTTRVSAAGIEAQCILRERGYNPGTVDGVFGTNSQNAMKRLQRDANTYGAGLRVDGLPGPASWSWLRVAYWG